MKRPLRMRTVYPTACAALALLLLLACGKGSDDRAPGATPETAGRQPAGGGPLRKILFVGVDGADWRVIEPLIAAGRLPNFAEIVRNGATGNLKSIEPMLSPLLWTSMATGRLPEDHGILSFTTYDPKTNAKIPISRLHRKADAFWNMLGDAGRRVDIVGWLATYPAESINGVMVTDRMGYLAYAGAGDATRPGSMSPESRNSEIASHLVKAQAVTYEEFRRFVHVDEPTFLKARAASFAAADPTNNMIMLYASTQSFRNIGRHLLANDRPDFLGVYYELVDATCHLFMPYAPPRRPGIDAKLATLYEDAVAEAYVLQDEIVGEMLRALDASTILMLVSDHGFKSGDERLTQSADIRGGKAALWHRLDGVICLYGNGIRKGHKIQSASILDVAPTILALQGLPDPDDMPGNVIRDALDDSLAARSSPQHVATLGRPRDMTAPALGDDAGAKEALEKLQALGYLALETPDAHNNLGLRYQKQGDCEKAIAEFEKAIEMQPEFPGVLNNIGVCWQKLGDHTKAEAAFRRALELNPKNAYAMNNLAISYVELGRMQEAKKLAKQAVTIEPRYANGHITLGNIHGTLGELEAAAREFRTVLEIDPANRQAKESLARVEAAAR